MEAAARAKESAARERRRIEQGEIQFYVPLRGSCGVILQPAQLRTCR